MIKQMTKQRINLIPKELQIAAEINTRKILAIWVLLVISALLAIHVAQKAYVLKYKNQIAGQNIEGQLLVQQKTDLDQKIAEFNHKLPNRDELKDMGRMVKNILSNYTSPSALLKELSFMMPPEVWVTQLSLTIQTEEKKDKTPPNQSRLLTIEGIALGEEALAGLLTNLESHPWFKKIKLDWAERERSRYQKGVFTYLIKGRLEERKHEN